MTMMFIYLTICAVISLIKAQDVDISALSELSLDKLLRVQKSFLEDVDLNSLNSDFNNKKAGNATEKLDKPEALALKGKQRKPLDRGGNYHHVYSYDDDHHEKKHDKKDIQSIFQISVTTLAFLAFGGYLLCLLCQAISSKNDASQNTTSTQVVQALIKQAAAIRRGTRRPNNRNRRPTQSSYPYRRKKKLRPTRYPRIKRESVTKSVTENMYWAMIRLSEGYSTYHTYDYKIYNKTGFT